MSDLRLFLFGAPRVEYDRKPVIFGRRKSQALLFYLCLNRQRVGRNLLATLLWPDSDQQSARVNLRHNLSTLTTTLDSHLFAPDRESIAFASEAEIWTDVQRFRQLSARARESAPTDPSSALAQLTEAVALRSGSFLAGFSIANASEYEDWVTMQAEHLDREFAEVLERLVQLHVRNGAYHQAMEYAQQWIQLNPLHEPAYRALMDLHARQGDRAEALQVYDDCMRVLRSELGADPDPATQALHLRLLNDEHTQTSDVVTPATSRMSPAAERAGKTPTMARPAYLLVGRETEWRQVLACWQNAVSSKSCWLSIEGDPGIGKSRLAEELLNFVNQSGGVALRARCFAEGRQLAYGPIIEWLRSGYLWTSLIQLDKIWLAEIARLMPELYGEVEALPIAEPISSDWQRRRLWDAFNQAILSSERPTLLVLDDLQWCEPETLDWLVYLLHSGLESGLMIVSAERSREITTDHPWHRLSMQLARDGVLEQIRLDPLGEDSTTALAIHVIGTSIDCEDAALIYRETRGNPLYVVETVQARTVFVTTPSTTPLAAESVDPWDLPAKIRALIQSRLAQLSSAAQELIDLAACFGQAFSFVELEAAGTIDQNGLAALLEEIWERGIFVEQSANTYDFSHDWTRDVAYDMIGLPRRRLLHSCIADAQVEVFGSSSDEKSLRIARQYELAGQWEEAACHYQYAAATAQRLYLFQRAVDYLHHGLSLLVDLPETESRWRRETEILLLLAFVTLNLDGGRSPALAEHYARARELAEKSGDNIHLCQVLRGWVNTLLHTGDWANVLPTVQDLLAVAEVTPEPVFVVDAHHQMGTYYRTVGRWTDALDHYQKAIALAGQLQHSTWDDVWYKGYPRTGTMGQKALVLWTLGYPDQARECAISAVYLARNYQRPRQTMIALNQACTVMGMMGDTVTLEILAKELEDLAKQHGFEFFILRSSQWQAWVQGARVGDAERVKHLERIMSELRANSEAYLPYDLALLAGAFLAAGRIERALVHLGDALAFAEESGAQFWNAELYRIKGECLLLQARSAHQDSSEEAEDCLMTAVAIARQQEALSLELRASVSLARLWSGSGRRAEAQAVLSTVLGRFTEGFETVDLFAAAKLLDNLSDSVADESLEHRR